MDVRKAIELTIEIGDTVGLEILHSSKPVIGRVCPVVASRVERRQIRGVKHFTRSLVLHVVVVPDAVRLVPHQLSDGLAVLLGDAQILLHFLQNGSDRA